MSAPLQSQRIIRNLKSYEVEDAMLSVTVREGKHVLSDRKLIQCSSYIYVRLCTTSRTLEFVGTEVPIDQTISLTLRSRREDPP